MLQGAWDEDCHFLYSKEFRLLVRTLLLAHLRHVSEDRGHLDMLPGDVLVNVVRLLAQATYGDWNKRRNGWYEMLSAEEAAEPGRSDAACRAPRDQYFHKVEDPAGKGDAVQDDAAEDDAEEGVEDDGAGEDGTGQENDDVEEGEADEDPEEDDALHGDADAETDDVYQDKGEDEGTEDAAA